MGLCFRIRDLGSGKTYSGSRVRVQGSKRHWIPDPGSRIPDLGSGIQIRNTADSYRNIGILSEVPTSANDIRRTPIEQKLGFSYEFTTFKLHVKRKKF
jgi:hypothetical protein